MNSMLLSFASTQQYKKVIEFIDYWNNNYFHSYRFVIGYTKWNKVYDSKGHKTDSMILDLQGGAIGFIFDKNISKSQYYSEIDACCRSYFLHDLCECIFVQKPFSNDQLELIIKWLLTDKHLNDIFHTFCESIENFVESLANNQEKECIIKMVDAFELSDSLESAVKCLKNLWNYLIRNNLLKDETNFIANYIAQSVIKNVQFTDDIKSYVNNKYAYINTQANELGYYLLYN